MTRIPAFTLAAYLFILTMLCPLCGNAAQAEKSITLGVLAVRPKPLTLASWLPLAEHLRRELRLDAVHVSAFDLQEMESALSQNRLDFVLTNPGQYIQLRHKNNLSGALATLIEAEAGQPVESYGATIFARKDRKDINTLIDLKGRTIAVVNTDSFGGYQAPAYELIHGGVKLPQDANLLKTGLPQDNVVQAVLAGKADAGFVRTGTLEAMAREGLINAGLLKILNRQDLPSFPYAASTRLYPGWVFISLPHVNEELSRMAAAALLGIEHGGPTARKGGFHGFNIPADYSPVETMLRELRLPPFDKSPQFTFSDVWQRYQIVIIIISISMVLVVTLTLLLSIGNRRLAAAQKRAQEGETKFRTLFESAGDAVFILTPEGRFMDVNKVGYERLGYRKEELLSMHVSQINHPAVAHRAHDALARLRNIGYSFHETNHMKKDGTLMPVEINARMIDYGGAPAVLSIIRDISERFQAEEALRRSEEYLHNLFDQAADAVFIHDHSGKILDCNRQACESSGYSRRELLNMNVREINIEFRPEKDSNAWANLKADATMTIEGVHRKKDGTTFPVEIRVGLLRHEDQQRIIAIARDITDRQRSEEQLRNAQKLESVGILAGGIAHDFNNLLASILGNIALAIMKTPTDSKAHNNLHLAEESCRQASELSYRLLTFSKGGEPLRKKVAIENALRETVQLALAGTNVIPEITLAGNLPHLLVDEAQIRQVFSNLTINANEAMPDGGRLQVRAEQVTVAPEQVLTLQPGAYIKITFQDQGKGIPPDIINRVFDPYFSTKSMGDRKGQGLGLTICHSIVKKHGGAITAESLPDQCAIFSVYLPLSPTSAQALPASKEAPAPSSPARKRILVMDDDARVRAILTELLEFFGHTVQAMPDSRSAVDAYRSALIAGNRFDTVILDLTIQGGQGGMETMADLLKIDPTVKALISSGYVDDPALKNFSDYGFAGAITKPYSADALQKALAAV